MLAVLQGRLDRKIGLEQLVIKGCRVRRANDDGLGFKELVQEVEWIDVEEVNSDEDLDSDESDYSPDGYFRYLF